jgi:hypothetical protein
MAEPPGQREAKQRPSDVTSGRVSHHYGAQRSPSTRYPRWRRACLRSRYLFLLAAMSAKTSWFAELDELLRGDKVQTLQRGEGTGIIRLRTCLPTALGLGMAYVEVLQSVVRLFGGS